MYTVKSFAKLLGISPSLAYALCQKGKIRYERHGIGRGCIRISPEAVQEYRERCTQGLASEPAPEPAKVMKKQYRHLEP
jgi:excisionase family DNA binding protein